MIGVGFVEKISLKRNLTPIHTDEFQMMSASFGKEGLYIAIEFEIG